MFTGIVIDTGQISANRETGGDRHLEIVPGKLATPDMAAGVSVAVNGVCLTVTETTDKFFGCDVSRETLELTTLGRLTVGTRVNLEPALKAGDELGGHLVTGHVDATGTIIRRWADGRSCRLTIRVPERLTPYIARKGSIAVDGVSLTVNDIRSTQFGVNIVPHTLEATILDGYRQGTTVNLEVDLVARYVEHWVRSGNGGEEQPPSATD